MLIRRIPETNSPRNEPVPFLRIGQIQGKGLESAYAGQLVKTGGIVTAVLNKGFFLQDGVGDGDSKTSDGIFIYTGGGANVAVGDAVQLSGFVGEFKYPTANEHELTSTQISAKPEYIHVISRGNKLPAPVVLGRGGLPLPKSSVPAAIDLYSSLEGMRVVVNNPRAVSATEPKYPDIAMLADNGADVSGLTARGAMRTTSRDLNPEVLHIELPAPKPNVAVGDRLSAVEGVVHYNRGLYKIWATNPVRKVAASGISATTTRLTGSPTHMTVASYNVENLDPGDAPSGRIAKLGAHIAKNLRGPDVLVLEEVQDNDGPKDSGGVDASQTYQALIEAIVKAGGPRYAFFDLPPKNNAEGGEPGGNIRVGLLYNPARVALQASSAVRVGEDLEAFNATRKSLSVQVQFRPTGDTVRLVGNHLSSKRGDAPTFGKTQPPPRPSDARRIAQAKALAEHLRDILRKDPNANVILAGDLNDTEESAPLRTLEGAGLVNLTNTLPEVERGTHNFMGNTVALDHIFTSKNLSKKAEYETVYLNTELGHEFKASDHNPVIARINFAK